MSKNLSRVVQPFVTSVIVGKDVVPRLSVVNIGRLIDQMVNLLLSQAVQVEFHISCLLLTGFFAQQVSALALCKHNKNQMLLRQMSTYWRHDRVSDLFWDCQEVAMLDLACITLLCQGKHNSDQQMNVDCRSQKRPWLYFKSTPKG